MALTLAQLSNLKAAILAVAAALSFGVSAQSLTPARLATLCAAVKADPAANAARVVGDAATVLGWLNSAKAPATLIWLSSVDPQIIDEAATYTTYDSLQAGKRDSWQLFLAYPRDFGRNKNRSWVTDVWGNATASSVAEAVLQAGTAPGTNAQVAIGGQSKTTGTVTALDANFDGLAEQSDANWLAVPTNCN